MFCKRLTSLARSLFLGAAVLAWLSSSATAAVISGVSATASTTFLGSATVTVNGAGLSGGLHDTNSANMWLSHTVNNGGLDTDPYLLIDLGAVYNVTDFTEWQYNLSGAHGKAIKNVDVRYSATNPAGTDNLLGSFVWNPNNAPGTPIPGDNYAAVMTARYVKLDINSSYDGDNGDDNIGYGLSEIQFNGTLVPEPSSVVLMMLGGVITVWFCKKRRQA